MESNNVALLIATMDTKGKEAIYIADCFQKDGSAVMVMDAGIRGKSPAPVHISREEVAEASGKTLAEVQNIGHEGKALDMMADGATRLARNLYREGKIAGIIGLGGSMGTTLATAVMRSFPIGFPKVMISTMASRDTRAFVGTKDILMLHSVCDLAGLNRITKKILHNGAMSLAGMIRRLPEDRTPEGLPVFLTTLGTTEACAQYIRNHLDTMGQEVVTFHTNGSGGQAMEEIIRQERVSKLVDLSLHEMVDHLFGGDYDAGPNRGRVALDMEIPAILVPGNIDFLVSGPVKTALRRFPNRPYHVHNAAITVVRTTRKEIEKLAKVTAELLNAAKGSVRMMIPMKGFSAFDHPHGPLHDPGAPELFADCLRSDLHNASRLATFPHHVNDDKFGQALIEEFGLLDAAI